MHKQIKNNRIDTANDTETKVSLSFEGKEAAVLAKSLPKQLSVIPEVGASTNTLALVDQKAKRMLLISCSNGEFSENGFKQYSNTNTKCTIDLQVFKKYPEVAPEYEVSILDLLGDATKLEAPVACLQK